jgi:xylose isomerase
LKIAHKIIETGEMDQFVEQRYASFTQGIGKEIMEGKVGFKELEKYAFDHSVIKNTSGRQEMLENMLNKYIIGG